MCSQGGGVGIVGGTVDFQNCNIYQNEAWGVSACIVNARSPLAIAACWLAFYLSATSVSKNSWKKI